MIRDAEQRTDEWFRDRLFDVCIVGSGPAGMTIARRLAAAGASVGLFEGGGLDPTTESQDLYKGFTTGEPYYDLDSIRLRYFGGSSNHWGGRARPLDAEDFAPLAQNPLSGWPISRSDLDPYLEETASILDLTPADIPPLDIFGGEPTDFRPIVVRFSPPTRFGEKYRAELEASKKIEVFLNANLVDIRVADGAGQISEAVFKSFTRPEPFLVKARFFAVCLGGLENPRALLNAHSQSPHGIGNENDNVGRFFMEHLHVPIGSFVLRRPLSNMAVYSSTPTYVSEKRTLHCSLFLTPDTLAPVETGAACVDLAEIISADMRGTPIACPGQTGTAIMVVEQALNPDSRLKLADTRDRFGLSEAVLDWRLSPVDFHTLFTAVMDFATTAAARDVARLKLLPWLLQPPPAVATLDQVGGGSHHMGTTRMSADPRLGVVDKDCRVHSLDNLYIGGSSVFATSGYANPTFTVVQLALRLGDHLAARVRRG